MKVIVNEKEVETQAGSLEILAAELGLPLQGLAMAVDNKMVPRTQWSVQPLHEGARIIVIKAVCGG